MDDPRTITAVLLQARGGNREAVDRVFAVVYDELRVLARHQLRGRAPGQTLDTAALIGEAYLRIIDQTQVEWQDRARFFGYAARAMRAVLVDHVRRRSTAKRGANTPHISLDERTLTVEAQADLLIALNDALHRLAGVSERLSRTVECRFFGGLTDAETAEVLGVSERTVRRDWIKAKAWLYTELREGAVG